ncbi:hypothetical protein [Kineococcus esterisolvens]|uniref:hypothetical protein n=1 Tax=unclassified Kineococcus TaxID=2621656 RepID=UPI003D7C77AD
MSVPTTEQPAGTEAPQNGPEGGQEATSQTPAGTESTEGQSAPEGGTEGQPEGIESLPEWAQRELRTARQEAANFRTKLRDAEKRLESAKTPEEVEAALAEMREENAKLARKTLVADVSRRFDLPDELAELLRGDSKEELEAHAKVLQKFAVPQEPQSLGGGLTPGEQGYESLNPRDLARKSRR